PPRRATPVPPLPPWGSPAQTPLSVASSRLYCPARSRPLLEVAKSILLILSALSPIVDPLGGSPVFLALTRDYLCPMRRVRPLQVALNSFILLIASFLIGTHILHFFGVYIPVVQVCGGRIVT